VSTEGPKMSAQGSSEGLVANIQVLMVRCGSTLLGIPGDISRGILDAPQVDAGHRVSAQGLTYPVTDLAARLGLEPSRSRETSRVILCARAGAQSAVLVDELFGLTDIGQKLIRSLPLHFTGPERDWFAGVFLFQERIAFLINVAWLLTEEAAPGVRERPASNDVDNRPLGLPSPQETRGDGEAIVVEQSEL
jgi:chemotaxis protein histidine kinase CheA